MSADPTVAIYDAVYANRRVAEAEARNTLARARALEDAARGFLSAKAALVTAQRRGATEATHVIALADQALDEVFGAADGRSEGRA